MWATVLLCLKFLGIIFLANMILSMLIMFPVLTRLKMDNHFKRLSVIKNSLITVFLIVNGLAFCYLLKMSLNTFETELLDRKQLFVILIILLIGNSLLNSIARNYKSSLAEKDFSTIDTWSNLEQNSYFSNIVMYKAMRYALGLGFWIWLSLIIAPSFQSYFMLF